MFEDSDDDDPRINTPELSEEKSISKWNFQYFSDTSGKCKIIEMILAILIIINVSQSKYVSEIWAIFYNLTFSISALSSFLIIVYYITRRVEKYSTEDWYKRELYWNTFMIAITTMAEFAFVFFMYYEYRTVKKVIFISGVSIVVYVYDASLKFVTDDFDFDDPLRLLNESTEEEKMLRLKKRKWIQ